jgi:hypothetical protein
VNGVVAQRRQLFAESISRRTCNSEFTVLAMAIPA